jgi:hypothetical protein
MSRSVQHYNSPAFCFNGFSEFVSPPVTMEHTLPSQTIYFPWVMECMTLLNISLGNILAGRMMGNSPFWENFKILNAIKLTKKKKYQTQVQLSEASPIT